MTVLRLGGLLLIAVGAGVLSMYAGVKLRLPFPDALIHRITTDEIIVYVDPVIAPVCDSVALLAGLVLLRSKRRMPET